MQLNLDLRIERRGDYWQTQVWLGGEVVWGATRYIREFTDRRDFRNWATAEFARHLAAALRVGEGAEP